MKIYLAPRQVGGPPVGGVMHAVYQLGLALTDLGHTIVNTPQEADVVHGHAFDNGQVYTSHGVYPKGDKNENFNRQLYNNIVSANFVTAVSRWTANHFRFTGVEPVIIPNGINFANLQNIPRPLGNYILWAKSSTGPTANAEAFLELARKRKDLKFVMTVAPDGTEVPSNVRIIGVQYHKEMIRFLGMAKCYVSTGTENLPIQVLEAMALGTPVLALPRGGVAEIPAIHLNEDLEAGLEYCLMNDGKIIRDQRSVIEMFDWKEIARMYLKVYEANLSRKKKPSSVSVVIPAYNASKTISAAIDSVLVQKPEEIIVVDDGSTDDLDKALKPYKGQIKLIRQQNARVSAARNKGISEAKGSYICCLDADDRLSPNFLAEAKKFLDNDPGLGIAYPGMTVFSDGKQTVDFEGDHFNFDQLTKGNFIPCANLFRKTAWQRAGKYKNINPSWEDYDLWLSITELGYNAQLVPGERLLYATHPNGRTGQEQRERHSKLLRATVDGYHKRLYGEKGWVTFIIPCYQQWQYVEEALESVFNQTYPHVKAIIVDDASPDRPPQDYLEKLVKKYPRLGIACRQVNGGLSAARNTGIGAAKTDYIVLLDADDKVHHEFVAECLKVGYDSDKYVYTDILTWHTNGSTEPMAMPDFDCQELIQRHQHACTILIPRKWMEDIGGYDDGMKQGWEDYELALRLVKDGHCGQRVPKKLFYYRWRENSMRQRAELVKEDINRYIWSKHQDIAKKGFITMCCGNKRVSAPVYQDMNAANGIAVPEGFVLVEYGGNKDGEMTKHGGQGRVYKYSSQNRFFPVHKNDLSIFGPKFRQVIRRTVAQTPPPKIEDPVAAMPEGDEDLMVVDGMTLELQDKLKQAGITTILKLVATPNKKLNEIVGGLKLAKSIQSSALLLSKETANVGV